MRPDLPDGGQPPPDEPVEVRRYTGAVRRHWRLIAGVVAAVTLVVLGASLLTPKTYTSTASVVLANDPAGAGGMDVQTLQRELSTMRRLATTPTVLTSAADKLPGETVRTLKEKVRASVDPDANLIGISASDRSRSHARVVADAVARTFIRYIDGLASERTAGAVSRLVRQLAVVQSRPDSDLEAAIIRRRIAALNVSSAADAQSLELAQPAAMPTGASSPKPVRNSVLALLASLLLVVLFVLGREQLVARVREPRELAHLIGLPILIGLPYRPARFGRTPRAAVAEQEAFQTLQAQLRFRQSSGESHVVLLTSTVADEGTARVVAGLGAALAQDGERTLIVSADMGPSAAAPYTPRTERSPGLAELLALAHSERRGPAPHELAQAIRHSAGEGLDVLPAGTAPASTAQLLSSDALRTVVDELRALGYTYILLEAPPLLGRGDTQLLARDADAVIVVARLDRLTVDNVLDGREVLGRLNAEPLGVVVFGGEAGVAAPYVNANGHVPGGLAERDRPEALT